MNLFFVSMDKVYLMEVPEVNSVVFLGLNHLIGRPVALVIVTLAVGFSASMLIFATLSFFLAWLPDHVRSGTANFTSRAMLVVGCIQAFLIVVAPGERIDTRSSFHAYAAALLVIAVGSGIFFFSIGKIERRLLSVTMGLVVIPPLALLAYDQLLRIGGGGVRSSDYSHMLVLVMLSVPLLWTYASALASSLASTSVRVTTLLFRSEEVASKPFATASIFLAFLAALVGFAFIQATFLLGG